MSDQSAAVPDPETAVVVRALEKSYGGRPVLRGVDFDVRRGEVFCLLGPNGAGKTTTVEILEGFRDRTAGTVTVLGLDPAAQSTQLRERIGIVLQECGFPRQARVGELIDIWRDYYPKPRPLEDLLEVVELSADRGTPVRKLSVGQRRRLDFALALAGDPDLVFLDEPTTGFDPEARRRCWAAIENLRGLGKTILLTTHYLDEAERLADRVAILLDGRIEVAGPTRDVARGAGLATRVSFGIPDALRSGRVPPPDGLDLHLNATTATCHTRNSAVALRALLDWASRYDVGELTDLSVITPSLEQAYLHLVEHNGDSRR
jgi:ABC-2 type transport system ATP-binding protein